MAEFSRYRFLNRPEGIQERKNIIIKNEGEIFNPNVILQKLDTWLKIYLQKIENGGKIYKNLKKYIRKILCEDSEAIIKRLENIKFPC